MKQVVRGSRPRAWVPLLGCALFALSGSPAAAQSAPHSTTLSYAFDSGPAANAGTRPEVVISFPVHVQGARWMRLHFQHVQLSGSPFAGNGAILRMTSIRDAEVQEMSAVHVRQWQRTSAYFNGDTVLVEVVAQPGTAVNHVVLDSVTVDLSAAPGVHLRADRRPRAVQRPARRPARADLLHGLPGREQLRRLLPELRGLCPGADRGAVQRATLGADRHHHPSARQGSVRGRPGLDPEHGLHRNPQPQLVRHLPEHEHRPDRPPGSGRGLHGS